METYYGNTDEAIRQPQGGVGRLLAVVTALILVMLIMLTTINHYAHERVVTLEPTGGTTITINNTVTTNGSSHAGTVAAKVTVRAKVRLSPGTYLVTFSGNGYASQTQTAQIADSNISIATPQLAYSSDRLQSILSQQSTAILAVVHGNSALAGYTVSYQKLYDRGEWYAAKLTAADPTSQDPQRLVLHQQNNSWQVVAGPSFLLYRGDFPSIPAEVLSDIDNQ